MHCRFLLCVFLSLLPRPAVAQPPTQLVIGFQAGLGYDPTVRFGPLMAVIGNATGLPVRAVTYASNTDLVAASVAQQLDLVYSGPVMFSCLQAAGPGIKAMNELISLNVYDNTSAVEPLAGAIIGRSGNGILTPADLRGKVILTGNIANLASFQAQWAAIEGASFSLFRDAKGVFFSANPTTILQDLSAGIGDVAFVEASVAAAATAKGFDGQVVLLQPEASSYPYPRSTPLYAYSLISAQNRTSFQIRASVSTSVLTLPPDSPQGSVATGDFYSWSTSGDYGTIRSVLTEQHFYDPVTGLCKLNASAAQLVSCPAGYEIVGNPDTACQRTGVPCPANYSCICTPCVRIAPPDMVAGMTVPLFAAIVAVVVVVVALTVFVLVRLAVLRHVTIPYQALLLHAPPAAAPLGTSSHGLVLRGTYEGQPVAVKRAFPRRAGGKSPFDIEQEPDTLAWHLTCAELLVADLLECFWFRTRVRSDMRAAFARVQVRQANVMPCLGVGRGPAGETLLIMPLMEPGTIGDLVNNKQHEMDADTVRSIATDVANAMVFLHACDPPSVGHNLKPHHLLLDASWRTLVGLSFRAPNTQSVWAPPECLRGGRWTMQADVYSFGMLLYTLVHRRQPFEGVDAETLLDRIRDASDESSVDRRPPMSGTQPVHDLIRACLNEEPLERPSFDKIRAALQAMGGTRAPRPSFSASRERPGQVRGMFPDDVRQLIEAGEAVPPTKHPEVTIFFSDIKGFTDIARTLQPELVQAMLDRLYQYMDRCAEDNGIHKMETIGDRYYVTPFLLF